MISLIANVSTIKNKLAIGKTDGSLLFTIKEDLQFFKKITTQGTFPNVLLMGRSTYESLQKKPLPGRLNFILTNNTAIISIVEKQVKKMKEDDFNVAKPYYMTLQTFVVIYNKFKQNVFIIGGAKVYNLFLANDIVDPVKKNSLNFLKPKKLYITEVVSNVSLPVSDDLVYMNHFDSHYKLIDSSKNKGDGLTWTFLTYEFTNSPSQEYNYINLATDILQNGIKKSNRTGVDTTSLIGQQLRFNIRDTIPLMTAKFTPFRVILEELLFFLRGDTDSKILESKNITIWKGNTSREFLDNRGLQYYDVGIMGPSYGWNYRFFGAMYDQKYSDTSKEKVDIKRGDFIDQFTYVEDLL